MKDPGKNGRSFEPHSTRDAFFVCSSNSRAYKDEEVDDLEVARKKLRAVGADVAIPGCMYHDIRAAYAEVIELTERAVALRSLIEDFWKSRIRVLQAEHEAHLNGFFPDGVPDNCQLEFEALSGLNQLEDLFTHLLRVVHNTVPGYPEETRDQDESG